MAKILCDTVGRQFVYTYYNQLHINPEGSYRFYMNSSFATWDMRDRVTTEQGIHDMIMSSDFKDCSVEIEDIQVQDSLNDTILVVVSGVATGKEKLRRKFFQTFVLARHETSFFVSNDILHFVKEEYEREPISQLEPAAKEPAVADVDNVSDVTQESDAAKVLEPTIVEAAEDETQPEQIVPIVEAPPKTDQKVSEVVPSVVEEVVVVPEVAQTVSDIKDPVSEAPKENAPKLSYLEMVSKAKTSSTNVPVTQVVRVSAMDGLPEKEKAKARPLQNGSVKAMALASETRPDTPSSKNSVHENNNIGPKGIYVGGLLPETTVEDLASAVKVFGKVKRFSDSVQVIRADERYSYGFVNFQFAESAKKAVEAKVITVLGKDAYISLKKSGRSASNNGGYQNQGRSGRGSGSHSRTPSSRAPSPGIRHVSNGEMRHISNNGQVASEEGDEEGWTVKKRRQRGNNGKSFHSQQSGRGG